MPIHSNSTYQVNNAAQWGQSLLKEQGKLRQHLLDESGNMVLATGALSLLLIFAMVAVNAAHYYNYKTRLGAMANTIASFAGNSLPNPSLANSAAVSLLELLKAESIGTAGDLIPDDINMQVYLEYYEIDISDHSVLKRAPFDADKAYKLPIKSLTVELSAPFNAQLVNFFSNAALSLASVTIKATATTQLVPTDVVLLIENSNSVMSPVAEEIDEAPSAFTQWADDYPGRSAPHSANYGSTPTAISSAKLKERQCFGTIHKDIKRAALMAYDFLTSSGTYRVGVVHTLSRYGEFPSATIEITSDSYARSYTPTVESDLLRGPILGQPTTYNSMLYAIDSNNFYGDFEYEASRCAALTSISDFSVPHHPLANYVSTAFSSSVFKTDLTAQLKCSGLPDDACPNNSHLEPSTGATLLPRDRVWIMNGGKTFESGLPNPQYDYSRTQLGIFRAIDMLQTAPARADNIPVRRKIVLVFTDGFERLGTVESGNGSGLNGEQFSRTTEIVRADTAFSPTTFNLQYPQSGTGLTDRYCSSVAGNIAAEKSELVLSEELPASENEGGIKLGILYHGDRNSFGSSDPLHRLANLQGHNPSDTDPDGLAAFEAECNTKWAQDRGRFLIEASSLTLPDSELTDPSHVGAYYYEQIVPRVLRSTFVSELLYTNAIN